VVRLPLTEWIFWTQVAAVSFWLTQPEDALLSINQSINLKMLKRTYIFLFSCGLDSGFSGSCILAYPDSLVVDGPM
jgi:hypothetical protein